MTSKLYAVISWSLIVLGIVHLAAAFHIYASITMQALWFFAGGLLIVLGAVVNLLNRSYGLLAPGVRFAAIAANVAIGSLAVAGGVLSHAGTTELVVVCGAYVAITVLSCNRGALLASRPAAG